VRAILLETEGNPFFIEEVLRPITVRVSDGALNRSYKIELFSATRVLEWDIRTGIRKRRGHY